MAKVRITNKKEHAIGLPPVKGVDGRPDWQGLLVQPGAYNIEAAYLEALTGPHATPGAKRALELLTTDHGEGAALEVSTDPKAVQAKEGPQPPRNLRAYREELAVQLARESSDAAALEQWAKDPRPKVAEACRSRLATVRGA